MKIIDELFRSGQASFVRGVGLRTIADEFNALDASGKDEEAASLALGYLDGIVSAIRSTNNLLSQGLLK